MEVAAAQSCDCEGHELSSEPLRAKINYSPACPIPILLLWLAGDSKGTTVQSSLRGSQQVFMNLLLTARISAIS